MARTLSPELEAAIQRAAQQSGVDPAMLHTFVLIESGGNAAAKTGSYGGLLQLSAQEFAKHGGQGDIHDVDANLSAGARKLASESAGFRRRYGRDPTASELYLIHQQGVGGSAAHWSNPDAPAWQNMLSTAEGRKKGEKWAKAAIWGNVPDDVKARFGYVDNLTSRDFVKLWDDKVSRFGGGAGSPGPMVAIAPGSGGGGAEAAVGFGLLASLMGGKKDPTSFSSLMGGMSDAAPKTPTAPTPNMPAVNRHAVSPAQFLEIVSRRQKLGTA